MLNKAFFSPSGVLLICRITQKSITSFRLAGVGVYDCLHGLHELLLLYLLFLGRCTPFDQLLLCYSLSHWLELSIVVDRIEVLRASLI